MTLGRALRTLVVSGYFWRFWGVNLLVIIPATVWASLGPSLLGPFGMLILFPLSFSVSVVSVAGPLGSLRVSTVGAVLAAASMALVQFIALLAVGLISFSVLSGLPYISRQVALEASVVIAALVSGVSGIVIAEAARVGFGEGFRRGFALVRRSPLHGIVLAIATNGAYLLASWPLSRVPDQSVLAVGFTSLMVAVVAGAYSLAVTLFERDRLT